MSVNQDERERGAIDISKYRSKVMNNRFTLTDKTGGQDATHLLSTNLYKGTQSSKTSKMCMQYPSNNVVGDNDDLSDTESSVSHSSKTDSKAQTKIHNHLKVYDDDCGEGDNALGSSHEEASLPYESKLHSKEHADNLFLLSDILLNESNGSRYNGTDSVSISQKKSQQKSKKFTTRTNGGPISGASGSLGISIYVYDISHSSNRVPSTTSICLKTKELEYTI